MKVHERASTDPDLRAGPRGSSPLPAEEGSARAGAGITPKHQRLAPALRAGSFGSRSASALPSLAAPRWVARDQNAGTRTCSDWNRQTTKAAASARPPPGARKALRLVGVSGAAAPAAARRAPRSHRRTPPRPVELLRSRRPRRRPPVRRSRVARSQYDLRPVPPVRPDAWPTRGPVAHKRTPQRWRSKSAFAAARASARGYARG